MTLSKMELIYNIVSLGYSPYWLDTDIVHMRSSLPFMADLETQGVHIAVSAENCATIMRRSLDEGGHLVDPAPFDHNTGILFISSAARSVRQASVGAIELCVLGAGCWSGVAKLSAAAAAACLCVVDQQESSQQHTRCALMHTR